MRKKKKKQKQKTKNSRWPINFLAINDKSHTPQTKNTNETKTDGFEEPKRLINNPCLPPLEMLRPKSNITLHKSQPNPVLSGQFTVITVGSPGFSACLMTTTSSYRTPILFPLFQTLSLSLFFLYLKLLFLTPLPLYSFTV